MDKFVERLFGTLIVLIPILIGTIVLTQLWKFFG